MFQARPINLKTEVWERIDAYLAQKANEDRNFKPNRSLFLEEAAVAFLDAAENPPAAEEEPADEESTDTESSNEESSDEESTDEEFSFDLDTDDKSTDEEEA